MLHFEDNLWYYIYMYNDKEWLYRNYIVENKTVGELAKMCGQKEFTIEYHLRKLGVHKSQSLRTESILRTKKNKNPIYQMGEEWVRKKYIDENLCIDEIAKILEISRHKVERYLIKHKIQKPRELRTLITSASKRRKNPFHKLDYDWFYQKFIIENLRLPEVAKLCGVPSITLVKKLRKLGIKKSQVMAKALIKDTCLNRYGVEYVSQSPEVLRKIRDTRVDNGTQRLVHGLSIAELATKYNISETYVRRLIDISLGTTDDEIISSIEYYLYNGMTDIECILDRIPELKRFNKKPPELSMVYKPDFKLNETTYINSDGLFYHCEKREDNNRYHLNMRLHFEEVGLRLLQFRADELKSKFTIVESMINNLLNKCTQIYARKTSIKTVNQTEAAEFLTANHMMGNYKAKHIGLYYEDRLVSLLSYKIYKTKIKIERFCSLINHNVVGGFSRLLKQVEILNNSKLPIHYWVDLRYGTGKFLLNQGFTFSHDTLGWKWTNCHKTFNRLKCRANMDERKLSEREYAKEKNWVKIYDAGQRLYVKSIV